MAVEPARDAGWFRDVVGRFCSGVTIVTAQTGGRLLGLTCQSFFSLSLAPPLVAFSPSRRSSSYLAMRDAEAFCINVLSDRQARLCMQFGQSGPDKWRDVSWHAGASGAPVLEGTLAWLECARHAEHEAGDHYLVVGRVLDTGIGDGAPLLFYRGHYAALPPAAIA